MAGWEWIMVGGVALVLAVFFVWLMRRTLRTMKRMQEVGFEAQRLELRSMTGAVTTALAHISEQQATELSELGQMRQAYAVALAEKARLEATERARRYPLQPASARPLREPPSRAADQRDSDPEERTRVMGRDELDTTLASAGLPRSTQLPPPPANDDDVLPPKLARIAKGVLFNIGELDPKRDDDGPVSTPRIVGRMVITTPPPPANDDNDDDCA